MSEPLAFAAHLGPGAPRRWILAAGLRCSARAQLDVREPR